MLNYEFNNFYSVIKESSKSEIIQIFLRKNWTLRKSSFTEIELGNDLSELTINEFENEILINGFILNPEVNYQIIIDFFKDNQFKFKSELYDLNQFVIRFDLCNF